MSTFFNRILIWMGSQGGATFADCARILLPIAVLVLLVLSLLGTVSDDVHKIATSL